MRKLVVWFPSVSHRETLHESVKTVLDTLIATVARHSGLNGDTATLGCWLSWQSQPINDWETLTRVADALNAEGPKFAVVVDADANETDILSALKS